MSETPLLSRPRILLPVALVSSGVLGYEILLSRLFAIIQWHHFAYMVISIALLGFGASGAFLCLTGDWLKSRYRLAFAANAALFSITMVASFLISQRVELNLLELAWSFGQAGRLTIIYLLLMVPFFFGANAIGLALMKHAHAAARVYAWDLVGAAAGAAGIVGALFILAPGPALLAAALPGLLAACLCAGRRLLPALLATALIAATALLLLETVLAPAARLRMSQYKALEQAMEVTGARLAFQRDGPLARISVVENDYIPLRHAPGLSLLAAAPVPPQVALFLDGDGPFAVTRFDGTREPVAFVDQVPSALAYHFSDAPSVLVLGLGGGSAVLQAVYHSAGEIDVVELNPRVVDLVKNTYGDYTGNLLGREDVRVFVDEARGFAEQAGAQYDLVQVATGGSLVAAGSGLKALSASYLYTVEGVAALLGLLKPGGYLSFSGWLKLPPRESVKLFATAVVALQAEGVADPGRRIAWLRSFNTYTLVIKNGDFGPSEASTLRAFAGARGFDVAFYPGMRAVEANRYNQLDEPWFYDAARALLSETRQDFLESYKFDIRPARDDRPYFFKFFKPAHAVEILSLKSRGGMGLVDLGYLAVWATLAQALVLSMALILLPLAALHRAGGPVAATRPPTRPLLAFFLCLGLGFIFIEVAYIDALLRILHHPLYAVAVVLAGFLLFAGLGARAAMRRAGQPVRWRILLPVIAIDAAGVLELVLIPGLNGTLMMLSDPLRVLAALVLIAPLAFFMGMPFPSALEALSKSAPEMIPWAWGANGCASVVGAVAAALIALSLGADAVVWLALGLYLAAGAFSLRAF